MKGDTGVIYPRRWKAIFSGVGGSGERRFCGDGRSLDPVGEVEKLPYYWLTSKTLRTGSRVNIKNYADSRKYCLSPSSFPASQADGKVGPPPAWFFQALQLCTSAHTFRYKMKKGTCDIWNEGKWAPTCPFSGHLDIKESVQAENAK